MKENPRWVYRKNLRQYSICNKSFLFFFLWWKSNASSIYKMGRKQSLRSKAIHLVSDLTTVLLNPISDKPSKPPPPSEDVSESERSELESTTAEGSGNLVEGPDTSSFTAFVYSLLSSTETGDNSKSDEQTDNQTVKGNHLSDSAMKENGGRKSLFSRGKQSLGRAIYQAARISGYHSQERKDDSKMKIDDGNDAKFSGVEMKHIQCAKESADLVEFPDISEPSILLSQRTRNALYASLPALIHGRKWMLLYSTWRHGISLSTLYRRSALWPGLSLLVVGDRKGAVFGGLVEAPLRPTNKRRYQGTNNTFVFTNISGHPTIFRPTGANRYFTLCETDFLAIGGGGHFALYLDGDLLNGSSSFSETYGNPCLAHSEDFEVKEIELWGFVYASKFEEVLALSRTEAPGICRW
ncbi:oxidation resistance protein 1-like [Quillaja saponaria]|uniref:Oxidation resistance protein 1 n=1 Tax=Quillaja saponaria TaxID=32244 RepID=A0AAD7P7Y6_QUISA|nr:oxidation resistance protein 1-like [Quillaja saponaria]